MPHGFKRDLVSTRALRRNRFLMERGSFMSLPDSEGKVHFHLEGSDRSRMRPIVWTRARGYCQAKQHAAGCPLSIGSDEFEMDHIRGGTSGRCDCLDNLRALSPECHRAKHVRVKLGRIGE